MVSTEEVQKVAENARISLDDEEVEKFSEEFEEVLDSFESLQEVDTEDVEPAFHPVEVDEETRGDQVEESISREEAFRNTGNVEDNMFKGPGV